MPFLSRRTWRMETARWVLPTPQGPIKRRPWGPSPGKAGKSSAYRRARRRASSWEPVRGRKVSKTHPWR
jgi:hypothetical protein